MAKRKAGLSDIIYELDNEDIEISSEDEVKVTKISRLESVVTPRSPQSDVIIEESCTDVVNVDSSCDEVSQIESSVTLQNGGKIVEVILDVEKPTNIKNVIQTELEPKKCIDYAKATILNEDIVVDSPSSNNYVNDFSNRTPLLSVRFMNNRLASNYKAKIKAFMLNLIKLHENESLADSENETDLELDIWPEDFSHNDIIDIEHKKSSDDNLFFVDTDPNLDTYDDVPNYSQASTLITNLPVSESALTPAKWKPTCFNCSGDHSLRECHLPRNSARIAENRKTMQKVGRYHIEDDQKYGHLIPGRISGHLRHALGLKRHEIPLHIYRMRLMGYPHGWLEEARISHSGITMFDSTGNAILDPEDEDGEVCEPGSKDKFDIKKILDYPGFNVPVSSRYKEEAHQYGLPPISEQDSKLTMLQNLAPNAMKAYKRKKLAFFPSAATKISEESQAEMELDSGDEEAAFPSVPPLPDEAPPPLPPPPPGPPPPDSPPPLPPSSVSTHSLNPAEPLTPKQKALLDVEEQANITGEMTTDDDLELTDVIEVSDIPMPIDIAMDDETEISLVTPGRDSPSLDDLELKKQLLLNALECANKSNQIIISDEEGDNDNTVIDDNQSLSVDKVSDEVTGNENKQTDSANVKSEIDMAIQPINSDPDITKNVENKTTGRVKGTEYGTPVINAASPYVKLPTDEKFAKDISDIINFENLPNSIGTFKRMSTLLKKVKSEVDRIQES